jgi:aryl-alcohol dehydrogenase-like predicted oxidoreductase
LPFGNQADEATCFAIMDVAYAAGVRLYDTADVYPPPSSPALRGRAEEVVGSWLESRAARQQVVLATKVGKPMGDGPDHAGLHRNHIRRACEASLRRLQTDVIDLYQAHVPDDRTPVEETLEALDELVQAGKVRYIGCSNYAAAQLVDALATSDRLGLVRFDTCQSPYNLLSREIERGILPLSVALGIGLITYSPLAGGILTDVQARRQATDDPVSVFEGFVAQRGQSLTQVALAWVLSQPGVTSTIVGASRPEQLVESLKAIGMTLDGDIRSAGESLSALPIPSTG